METVKIIIRGRPRVLTVEQAEQFLHPRKPTAGEIKFVDAYMRLRQRNPSRAYAIAYPHSASWNDAKRLKAAKKVLQRGAVDKLIGDRELAFVQQILGPGLTP